MLEKILSPKFIAGSIRFWLGFMLLSAGVTKLFHGNFIQLIGPPWLIEELAKYQLGLYAEFVAYSQIIIGFCLLVKRFATLGAVMAIPMFLNILMVTISQHWQGTPYVVAFLLLCNMYLLVFDFQRLKYLFIDDSSLVPEGKIQRKNLQLDLLYLFGLGLILVGVGIYRFSEPAAIIMAYLGLAWFVGVFGWQKITKKQ